MTYFFSYEHNVVKTLAFFFYVLHTPIKNYSISFFLWRFEINLVLMCKFGLYFRSELTYSSAETTRTVVYIF